MISLISIKVKTEVLAAKASSLQARTAEMRSLFGNLEQTVCSTSRYWDGEAGDKKRRDYFEKRQKTEELLKRLEEYPKDLLQMAGIYEEAEAAGTSISEALASEVII